MTELEKMNLRDLKELASKLKIPNRSKLRKTELVLALLKHQKSGSGSTAASAPAAMSAPAAGPQGSSAGSQVAEQARPDHGPDGDPGLPIPDSYGRDTAVLMVQDPEHVYVWWELSGGGLDRARSEAGGGSGVLVLHHADGSEQRDIDLAAGNYYLAVAPGGSYRVDIGLRSSDGRVIVIASTQAVTTPVGAISDRLDEEWMAVDEAFGELLDRAGLFEDGGMSSAERFRGQAIHTKLWAETRVSPISSGSLASGLSSLNLGSHTLSSWALTR